MGVSPSMEHSSFLHLLHLLLLLLLLLPIGVILGPVNAIPTNGGSRPTVHPDTTTNRWDTTTYPWRTTTNRWATTTYPWRTTTNPWDTTTYPWRTTTNRWDTTTRHWRTTTYPTPTQYPNTTYNPYTTTAYPTEGCPQGWVDSIEGCFLFHLLRRLPWDLAQYECESVGGFLAEPKTQQQVDMLKSLALIEDQLVGPPSAWWIGLTDQGHEGRWIWQHDIEDVSYTDWAQGSPHHGVNNLDCAVLERGQHYRWRDTDCTNTTAAPICQRERTGPVTTPRPTPTNTWPPYTTTKWS